MSMVYEFPSFHVVRVTEHRVSRQEVAGCEWDECGLHSQRWPHWPQSLLVGACRAVLNGQHTMLGNYNNGFSS